MKGALWTENWAVRFLIPRESDKLLVGEMETTAKH